MFVIKAIGLISFILTLLYSESIFFAHENSVGQVSGWILLGVEVGLFVWILVSWHFLVKNRSCCILFFPIGFALFMTFLGWFLSPEQVYLRTKERWRDQKKVIESYESAQQLGTFGEDYYQPPDPPNHAKKIWQVYKNELRARELEIEAARIRLETLGLRRYSDEFYRLAASVFVMGLAMFFILNQEDKTEKGLKELAEKFVGKIKTH